MEKLLLVRNILVKDEGKALIDYLQDLATDLALTSIDEKELKGFIRAISELKRVPNKVESIKKQK